MKILVITQQNSGVGYHRLMLPVYFLEKTYAYFTDTLNEETLEVAQLNAPLAQMVFATNIKPVFEAIPTYTVDTFASVGSFLI